MFLRLVNFVCCALLPRKKIIINNIIIIYNIKRKNYNTIKMMHEKRVHTLKTRTKVQNLNNSYHNN